MAEHHHLGSHSPVHFIWAISPLFLARRLVSRPSSLTVSCFGNPEELPDPPPRQLIHFPDPPRHLQRGCSTQQNQFVRHAAGSCDPGLHHLDWAAASLGRWRVWRGGGSVSGPGAAGLPLHPSGRWRVDAGRLRRSGSGVDRPEDSINDSGHRRRRDRRPCVERW